MARLDSDREQGSGRLSILRVLGFDPRLTSTLADSDRVSLKAGAYAWLLACLLLAAAAGNASYLAFASPAAAGCGFIGIFLLLVNLVRVVHAGGGSPLGPDLAWGKERCQRYRPSVVPSLIFLGFGALLAQPGQLPFWPGLQDEVEEHRSVLISEHEVAAAQLGSDPSYYRSELEEAGFPIYRIQQMWKRPRKAIRWTLLLCVLVCAPAFFTQIFSLRGRRAYEWARYQERFACVLLDQRNTYERCQGHLARFKSLARVANDGGHRGTKGRQHV